MSSTQDARRVGAQRPTRQLLPANAASSAAEEAEALGQACGLHLDDWQSWCLRHMLSEDPAGAWAASVICLILPRQNGKNAVLEVLELAAIFLFGETLIIHSAHLNETARTHMQRMKTLVAANDELSAITRFYDANGKERMVVYTGPDRKTERAEIRFMTRGNKTLRGGSPSRIVFDEALELTDSQIQAIVPSLSAQSLNDEGPPQMIYTSSAPLAHSAVLHRVRDAGLAGEATNMFYAEWGCEEGVDITDVEHWYRVNPGLGVRIGELWIRDNELLVLTPEGFSIERLGVVYPPNRTAAAKLPAAAWEATAIPRDQAPAPQPGQLTIAVDVDFDGAWASIAIATGDVADPYVELIEHRERTAWVPRRLVELVHKWEPLAVGINGAGPAGALIGQILVAFREADPKIDAELLHTQSANDYKAACGAFYLAVDEGRLRHLDDGQVALDQAALDAGDRPLGEGWAWDRRNATVPIGPLVAATIACSLLPVEAEKRPEALTQIF